MIALRLTLLGLGLMMLIFIPFVIWGDAIEATLTGWLAAPGSKAGALALIFAMLAGDVVLPLPSSLLSAAAPAIGGVLAGGVIVFAGMTTGHLIGYGLGRRYGAMAVSRLAGADAQERLEALQRGLGAEAALVLTRAVPVLSEAATVTAGAGGLSLPRFLRAVCLTNAAIAATYAVFAASIGGTAGLLAVFAAAVAVPALGYSILRLLRRP